MTNEIKEHMQNCIDREESCLLNSDNTKILLDYITNLQEDLENYVNVVLHNRKVIDNLQQRIDKAIDYIETHKEPLHHYFDEPDCDYWIATNPQDIIDILRGDE